MPEDIIKSIAVFIALIIAFPAIGIIIFKSIFYGAIIGLFIAFVIAIAIFLIIYYGDGFSA
ncbi:MAG: hypothetical protein KJ939_03855 [Nanoarchaeota archaeon]|nr:hypothetical protein [Nanoarchaeota archaeon]